MSGNKMKDVTKMLGVNMYEEFKIKGFKGLYIFSKDGLYAIDDKRNLEGADLTLVQLLLGNFEIAKTPWKPQEGDVYYAPSILSIDGISIFRWGGSDCDITAYDRGLVFKTKEEALDMAEKLFYFVKKERGI